MHRPSPELPAAGQRWDPLQYRTHGGFVPSFGMVVFDFLAPRPGERILDLGCGDGVLTEKIAAVADVVGVDASPEQVAAAKARGLDARVVAGEALTFADEFDAVFSNAALHWMRKPDSVIAGVVRALKTGGRFVGEMGGAENIARIADALIAELARRGLDPWSVWPWYYPDEIEYRQKLERAGLEVRSIERFQRPTRLPGPMADWIRTFCGSFLDLVPQPEQADFLAAIEARLAPALLCEDGVWTADYVRLRFAAVKP
jgi:trans-aconitate methyltransferase